LKKSMSPILLKKGLFRERPGEGKPWIKHFRILMLKKSITIVKLKYLNRKENLCFLAQ